MTQAGVRSSGAVAAAGRHPRALRRALAVLEAVPPAAMGLWILRYGVNVPFWDEWDVIPLHRAYDAGTLTWSDVWAPHNEHRIVIPKLAMLALARLTHGDYRWPLLVGFVAAAGMYLFLRPLLTRALAGSSEGRRGAMLVGASFVVFHTAQWENWLWSWQFGWFLTNLGFAAAVWGLDRARRRHETAGRWTAFAVCAALGGMFSTGTGIVIWPACLPLLSVRGRRSRAAVAWVGAGAIAVAVYAIGYVRPDDLPDPARTLANPLRIAAFVVLYLGRPLTVPMDPWGPSTAVASLVAGTALCLAFAAAVVAVRRRRLWAQAAPWLAVCAFSVLCALTTAVGRAGLGLRSALFNRYASISMLFLVGTGMLVALAARHARSRPLRLGAGLAGGVVAAVLTLVYATGLNSLQDRHDLLRERRLCFRTAPDSHPCIRGMHGDPARVAKHRPYLHRRGWAGLDPAAPVP